MEASTIKVEPVQKKGLKPKQLVRSVSNKYGKNGTYWKKKKDAISNEEYCNDSKMKGSSKIKRYFSKIISKIKNNHKSQVQWDFQCPGTQPIITEEINPTKFENSITEPDVEPKNQKLETNLSEKESIQTQEPLDLDLVIKKLNFMELEINTNTATTDSENSQNNPFANLSPNSGLKSVIYVRIGWEEYPVMAFLDQTLEYNCIPLKMAAVIGIRKISKKIKNEDKKLNKKIMNRVQVVLPTNETLYLRFMVEGNSSHIVLGKDFCDYFNWLQLCNSIPSSYEEEESNQSPKSFNQGTSALKDTNQSSEDLYEGMQVFSIGIMDFTQQDFHEMMTRREGSPYTASSPLTPLDEEEPFTLGDLLHDEYFNMGEINSEEYPIPQAVLQPGLQQSFDVDPKLNPLNISIPECASGPKKEHSDNKNYIQTFSPSINSLIQEIQSNCTLPTNQHVKDINETSLVKNDVMLTENFEEPLPTLEQLIFGEYFNNDQNPNKNLDTPQLQNLSLESPTFDDTQKIPRQNN
ncbi:hypothetical protein O181_111925 [Austropuccinia psidii MF-1]|uniref:Uncharacterized protein n=1 Tax=Austropuccinia psidii MF-1 TaxID=1389203 RepID=A0A9Q3PT00_9BASI|nr:hypothetical protein [Austropuccinia psidii MF-1]